MVKRGLGRGLQALLPEIDMETGTARVVDIGVDSLQPNRYQPRRVFDRDKLEELARSIQDHGIVQPIVVRAVGGGLYEIVAGERRWRACREVLGWKTIPALVREMEDQKSREVALVENLQREDLNPLEEAEAYRALMEDLGLTQEEVAQRVGKSRAAVANTVRLLNLPEAVKERIAGGEVSGGQARALLGLDTATIGLLAERAVQEGLTVRELERLVSELKAAAKPLASSITSGEGIRDLIPGKSGKRLVGESGLLRIAEKLQEALGTKVEVRRRRGGSGSIEIEFYSSEELERLLELLVPDMGL